MGKCLTALSPAPYRDVPETLPDILTGSGLPGGPGDSHFISQGPLGAFGVDLDCPFVLSPLPPRKPPGWRAWDGGGEDGGSAVPFLYPERTPRRTRNQVPIQGAGVR